MDYFDCFRNYGPNIDSCLSYHHLESLSYEGSFGTDGRIFYNN